MAGAGPQDDPLSERESVTLESLVVELRKKLKKDQL